MKKTITLFIILCFTLIGNAQVSKTINITTAGTLSTVLSANELNTITNLTITEDVHAFLKKPIMVSIFVKFQV